ncbi:hypothetical protein ACET3Z_019902 [Daucus carota]|nr:PREDICTED: uncharacterized protein LOC108219857 isoform X1 [Daucus carota subsp. sativus]
MSRFQKADNSAFLTQLTFIIPLHVYTTYAISTYTTQPPFRSPPRRGSAPSVLELRSCLGNRAKSNRLVVEFRFDSRRCDNHGRVMELSKRLSFMLQFTRDMQEG